MVKSLPNILGQWKQKGIQEFVTKTYLLVVVAKQKLLADTSGNTRTKKKTKVNK